MTASIFVNHTICSFVEAWTWPVRSFVGNFKNEFIAKGAADEERRAREPKIAGASSKKELTASLPI